MRYPTTPDGRYFVVKGRLWRTTDPSIPEEERQELVRQLMEARRDVGTAKKSDDEELLADARQRVQTAKVALGVRPPAITAVGGPKLWRPKQVLFTPAALEEPWGQQIFERLTAFDGA